MMPSSADPSWFEIRRYRFAGVPIRLVTGVALMAPGEPINPAVDASYFVT